MSPQLTEFIVRRTHLKSEDVKPELRLAEDIGYYGLDATSFMQDFFSEFEIPNLHDFDFDQHVDGGPDFVPRPLNWLQNVVSKERRKYLKPDVTLGHLDKVIEKREWFNER